MSEMGDWKNFLEQYDNEWQGINVDPSGNIRLPDGTYQVSVDSTYIEQTQTGRVIWKTTFKVLNPTEFQDRLIFLIHALDDPKRLPFVKQDCYRLGFPLTKLSELPDVLKLMLDVKVEVKLKTNGEYQNCYIQKRLEGPGTGTSTATGGQSRNTKTTGGRSRKSTPAFPPEVDPFAPLNINEDDLPF